ncbi:protein of unknown function [Taphrina deformans PYCC 5710]|uniref:Uncharacterized protein n=1 Tax=Taphrina deformans (strain PYCC 5710 / ATCC 11124 / CBS 356.35 / IMI 108563 / JCM 9778 / NBRC 8474) TaxID=1097556 RepID=R4XGQ9_TAPDE|nr:protein of unknown function [Taphrina deformans PYCC 5710]|eukprot:CCG85077.1 protein of unknown function [Taphrina deformans PYCC 5710]
MSQNRKIHKYYLSPGAARNPIHSPDKRTISQSQMSGITTTIKNAFKHPEDIASSSDPSESRKENERAASSSHSSTPSTDTGFGSGSGSGHAQQIEKMAGQHALKHEEVPGSVPSTGYVGDETAGRFPHAQAQQSGDRHLHAGTGTGTAAAGSHAQQSSSGAEESGREGVPGATTSGDPSMGGKFTRAQGGT